MLNETAAKNETDDRIYYNVKIRQEEISGLFDTGATHSFLGKGGFQFLKKIGLKPKRLGNFLRTADGSIHKAAYIVELPITFNNLTKNLNVIVYPGLTCPLYLGMDFCRLFGIHIVCPEVNECVEFSETGELTEEQKCQLAQYVQKFLITKDGELGCTNVLKHTINTGDSPPIRQRSYPIPFHKMKKTDAEIKRLLKMGIISLCRSSPWSNPITVVDKKNNQVRICLDARALNSATIKDTFALPNIDNILSKLTGTKYLTSLDLSDAFFQIELEEKSKLKTAFCIPGRPMYVYNRMPFGCTNSAQEMSRLMSTVIGEDLEPRVHCFIDDIIIATETFEDHLYCLGEVSRRLREANLSINIVKSKFCVPELVYLGYTVSPEGISPNNEKVKAILDLQPPSTVKQVRQLMGMMSWFRRFIPNFSEVAAPITDLLRGNPTKIEWTPHADQALVRLKELLTQSPILATPNYSQPFTVKCDSSEYGAGGCLLQGCGDNERVIAYYSHKYSVSQRNYSTTERECLAVVLSVEKFRDYIEGSEFTVETDHSALLWLMKSKDVKGRLARWVMKLQHHNFKIIHRPGKEHVLPDYLSRNISAVEMSGDKWYRKNFENVARKPLKFPDFMIKDDQLYKNCKFKNNEGTFEHKWKLIVPKESREAILTQYHDDPSGGHLGFFKTFHRVAEFHYWPKMRQDVSKHVRGCEICKATKSPNFSLTPPMGEYVEARRPWEFISGDFIGPLIRTKHGNTFLLVIVDKLTKFVLMFPVRNAKAYTVKRILRESVFPIFGCAKIFLTDSGPGFIGKELKEYLARLNITHWTTAAYHPQANFTERYNRGIITSIKAYIRDKHSKWDEHIPDIAISMRASVHDTTRYSPYYLNFGQQMIANAREYATADLNLPQSDADRFNAVSVARIKANSNLERSHERSAKHYNKNHHANDTSFKVGDILWRRNFRLSNAAQSIQAKFLPTWIKARVISVNNNVYIVQDVQDESRRGLYHKKDLKPDN
ncbi:Reverse transcriptase, RNase H-like domain [Sergentomyia squamirostris]